MASSGPLCGQGPTPRSCWEGKDKHDWLFQGHPGGGSHTPHPARPRMTPPDSGLAEGHLLHPSPPCSSLSPHMSDVYLLKFRIPLHWALPVSPGRPAPTSCYCDHSGDPTPCSTHTARGQGFHHLRPSGIMIRGAPSRPGLLSIGASGCSRGPLPHRLPESVKEVLEASLQSRSWAYSLKL